MVLDGIKTNKKEIVNVRIHKDLVDTVFLNKSKPFLIVKIIIDNKKATIAFNLNFVHTNEFVNYIDVGIFKNDKYKVVLNGDTIEIDSNDLINYFKSKNI